MRFGKKLQSEQRALPFQFSLILVENKMITKTDKEFSSFYSVEENTNKLLGIVYSDDVNKTNYQQVNFQLNLEKNQNDSMYVTITEEVEYRPDILAVTVYGDEKLYWVILQHNNLIDPFELENGLEVEIPNISKVLDAIQLKKNELKIKVK